MDLHHANVVDASGSTFYDIAGDQILNFQLIVSGSNANDILHQLPRPIADALRSPISGPGDLIQRRSRVIAYFSQSNCGLGDDIPRLITKILALLDHGNVSCSYRGLKTELEALQYTLTLTSLGIKAFENTELGQSLARAVIPELLRCVKILQELFHAIDAYRQGLWGTWIRSFWHVVWRNGCDVDDLDTWRNKLFACRNALGTFVMALHS
jgi:hypothetical protein